MRGLSTHNGPGRSNSFSNGPTGPYDVNPLIGQPLNWVPEIYRDGLWSGTV